MTYTYNAQDLRARYDALTGSAIALCRLTRELVGGMSADEDGLRNFVEHQLGLKTPEEIEAAVRRIRKEEIGERNLTPKPGGGGGVEGGGEAEPKLVSVPELEEKLTYGVNIVRKDSYGPWLGDWMAKACFKSALSRIGLFMQKKGTKGDVAEMGLVESYGISRAKNGTPLPYRIYFRSDRDGKLPVETYFQQFKGRVSTPQGMKSIVNDCECVPTESWFAFKVQFYNGKLTADNIADAIASMQVIGLGSAKAMERGKFVCEYLEVTIPEKKKREQMEVASPEEAAEKFGIPQDPERSQIEMEPVPGAPRRSKKGS